MRAAALLPALSLDVATQWVARGLAALRAMNWPPAKQRATHVFTALGAACGMLLLFAGAATAVLIASQPAEPYPRTTMYNIGGNPGPVLVEFGSR